MKNSARSVSANTQNHSNQAAGKTVRPAGPQTRHRQEGARAGGRRAGSPPDSTGLGALASGFDFSALPILRTQAVGAPPSIASGPAVQLRAAAQPGLSDAQVQAAADQGLRSGGQSLPHLSQLERGFGAALGSVRVHSDAQAVHASRAMGAEAFTRGEHIGLAAPSPSLDLLAHEVAHVVQQRAGAGPASGVGRVGDSFEREAHAAAAAVSRGQVSPLAARYGGRAPSRSVQRSIVQRYESGEHAILGVGPDYPFMDPKELSLFALPNGVKVHPGELVALAGDLYTSIQRMERLPPEETEALVGFVRLEALWFQVRREAFKNRSNSSAGNPKEESLNLYEESKNLPADHPIWQMQFPKNSGKTAAQWRDEIYRRYQPYWTKFKIFIDPREKLRMNLGDVKTQLEIENGDQPEGNLVALKATMGRRRFRGFSDPLVDVGERSPSRKNRADQITSDPAELGPDYVDMAAQNVSHFGPDNWEHWKEHHIRAFSAYRNAQTAQERARALAEDMAGLHYLTDRFSAGHTVNKEGLMQYATELIIQKQKSYGDIKSEIRKDEAARKKKREKVKPGETADASKEVKAKEADAAKLAQKSHEILEATLTAALGAAFKDPEVASAWHGAVDVAIQQQLISPGEAAVLHAIAQGVFKDFPSARVQEQVAGVLLGMPWRDLSKELDTSERTRSYGPVSTDTGRGAYQLGAGNLAALLAHDMLNEVGFIDVKTGNDSSPFEMRGDNHLTEQTMERAQRAVKASQQQIMSPESLYDGDVLPGEDEHNQITSRDLDIMRSFIPYQGTINYKNLLVYMRKAFPNAEFNQIEKENLLRIARNGKIDLQIDLISGKSGAELISPALRALTEQMINVLLLAPVSGTGELDDPSGTGLNVSFFRAFLKKRLSGMVAMSYIAAAPDDLQESTLSLYAPRNKQGAILPRSASAFSWSGNHVNFMLDVTGVPEGAYTLGVAVFEKSNNFDVSETGQSTMKGHSSYGGKMRPSATAPYDIDVFGGTVGDLMGLYRLDSQVFPPASSEGIKDTKPGLSPEMRRQVPRRPADWLAVSVPAVSGRKVVGGRQYIHVSYDLPDELQRKFWRREFYIRVFADPDGTMIIGRSPTRGGAK